jgi:hypothetical protein
MTSTIPYFKRSADFKQVMMRADESWADLLNTPDISWRLHTFNWICESIFVPHRPGVFVECGTGKGYMANALTKIVELRGLKIQAYLIDTFESDLSSITGDPGDASSDKYWSYASSFSEIEERFSNFSYCHLIKGKIPQILNELPELKIDLLHIDLNHGDSEIAALEFLLPKMSKPSFILLDDYAFHDKMRQGKLINEFTEEHSLPIMTLATGQGIIFICS